ncbi:TRAP transporter small permease [Planococcus sp. X10-3]|uniref:TRAP transporter small permease n=1 Tax=Planococcus sp. X10-3 TaxID=3061240 RepID=UPI003BB090F7
MKIIHHITNISNILKFLIALCLASMAVLIFGNVVLRYGFNTGIVWAEEMSRFLFVWMIFLGAIVALKENNHLSVDILTKRVPPPIKKFLYIFSNLIVLFSLWIVLEGSWNMTLKNLNNTAPVTKLPYAYLYGVGIIMSIGMGSIVIVNIIKALFFSDIKDEKTQITE